MPTSISDIRDFVALKRIALIGVSRDPKHFSRYLFQEMSKKGYDLVPVNPAASELEGKRSFAHAQEIQPPVEGAIVLTPPQDTERVVRDCAEAGIRRIWMHHGGGQGSVSPAAVDFCHQHGIQLVEGYCPFMFLPETQFFHRVHGFFLKLTGSYPREAQRPA
jgi:predicted CoA-binding protein